MRPFFTIFITIVFALDAVHAGTLKASSRNNKTPVGQAKPPPPPPNGPFRRARSSATPRKLESYPPNAFNFLPRALVQSPVGNLLNMPRDILQSFVGGGGGNNSPMTGFGGGGVQKSLGDMVDRSRNVADTSLDTVEQLAQGMAQRSRGVIDRATSRAAGFVDQTVALGTNGLGAGLDAARGLQEEAQRMAQQAAGIATGSVKAGELALAGAFDRIASAVNNVAPTQDSLLVQQNGLAGLITNPLNSIMGLAAART